jgi:hypothetical protein
MGNHKLALIDHLRGLEDINVKLDFEKNKAKKSHLLADQKRHIKAINTLIPFLNGIGKLSDKEAFSLMSLDLMNMKDLHLKFRMRRGE